MMFAPTVLKAFTTLAPGAHDATCSAAEEVVPTASPDRSGFSGLIASMSIFPDRFPALSRICFVAGHGVARIRTSPALAAPAAVAALAEGPASATSCFISADCG